MAPSGSPPPTNPFLDPDLDQPLPPLPASTPSTPLLSNNPFLDAATSPLEHEGDHVAAPAPKLKAPAMENTHATSMPQNPLQAQAHNVHPTQSFSHSNGSHTTHDFSHAAVYHLQHSPHLFSPSNGGTCSMKSESMGKGERHQSMKSSRQGTMTSDSRQSQLSTAPLIPEKSVLRPYVDRTSSFPPLTPSCPTKTSHASTISPDQGNKKEPVSSTLEHLQRTGKFGTPNEKGNGTPESQTATPSTTRTKPYSLDYETQMREEAKIQNAKLELERQKLRESLRIPHLTPSPRSWGSGLESVLGWASGYYKPMVKNVWFWVGVVVFQIGLVSTGAAFAVVFRGRVDGDGYSMGAGILFWLITSICFLLLGFILTLFVYMRTTSSCLGLQHDIGLDELGLLSSYHPRSNETEMTAGIRLRDLESERERRRQEWELERQGEMDGHWEESKERTKAKNVIWEALYDDQNTLYPGSPLPNPHPSYSNTGVRKLSPSQDQRRPQVKRGPISLMSQASSLKNFNELDAGAQPPVPTPYTSTGMKPMASEAGLSDVGKAARRLSVQPMVPEAGPSDSGKAARRRSKVPKAVQEGRRLSQRELEEEHYGNLPLPPPPTAWGRPSASSSISVKSSKRLSALRDSSKMEFHSASGINVRDFAAKTTSPQSSSGNAAGPCAGLRSRDTPLPFVPSTTEISTWSPLEDLARGLNGKEIKAMPVEERSEFIAGQRRQSEERGRRVRQSLERTKSNRSTGERRFTITKVKAQPLGGVKEKVEKHEERSRSGGSPSASTCRQNTSNINPLGDKAATFHGSISDGKATAPSEGNSLGNAKIRSSIGDNLGRRKSSGLERVRSMIDVVNDHFTEHHGRSLSSVVREKMARRTSQMSEMRGSSGGGSGGSKKTDSSKASSTVGGQ